MVVIPGLFLSRQGSPEFFTSERVLIFSYALTPILSGRFILGDAFFGFFDLFSALFSFFRFSFIFVIFEILFSGLFSGLDRAKLLKFKQIGSPNRWFLPLNRSFHR